MPPVWGDPAHNFAIPTPHLAMPAASIVHNACPHDCPDTCAIETTVADGRVIHIAGAKDHPPTEGVLCTKVARYRERLDHPDRLLQPMRRIGRKGEGRFEAISWDEALDLIAERLQPILARDPERVAAYSYAGTMGLIQGEGMAGRFFHRIGASRLDRTICSTAGKAGLLATLGVGWGPDVEQIERAGLIVIWGSNLVTSAIHVWRRIQRAQRAGVKVICIDPLRTDTAARADLHLALRPGTDTALVLAVMHCLIRDDRLDHDYIARHTTGFDALAAHVRNWTPGRAAAICGIAEADIEAFAHLYGTTRPTFIRANYGLARHAGGGMAMRAIACLPALTGDWRFPAGGLLLSSSDHFGFNPDALLPPGLPCGKAGPPPRLLNMSRLGEWLTPDAAPPIEALFVYNSNPVAIAPDARRVIAGFSRNDLLTVVLEHFQTDTADYADLILPATMQFEHLDLHKSYGHRYVLANLPAVPAPGACLPNSEIFRRIAARLGLTDPALKEDDETIARQLLASSRPEMAGITWDRLVQTGWTKLALPENHAPFAQGGFATTDGKCPLASAAMAAAGHPALPTYLPPPGADPDSRQLTLLSPPARNFLNSSFANVASLREREGEPSLHLHPDDAAARGIATGDAVRVWNAQGELRLRARIDVMARPGVAVAPSIWWRKHAPDGRGINELTDLRLTDLGAGPTFYDCRVDVARLGSTRSDKTAAAERES